MNEGIELLISEFPVGLKGLFRVRRYHPSMPPNVFVRVALAHSDDGTVTIALHQVTTHELREALDRVSANLPLHLANAVFRKIADNPAVAVKYLIAILNQPITDQGRYSTLLCALGGVICTGSEHICSLTASEGGRSLSRC